MPVRADAKSLILLSLRRFTTGSIKYRILHLNIFWTLFSDP